MTRYGTRSLLCRHWSTSLIIRELPALGAENHWHGAYLGSITAGGVMRRTGLVNNRGRERRLKYPWTLAEPLFIFARACIGFIQFTLLGRRCWKGS